MLLNFFIEHLEETYILSLILEYTFILVSVSSVDSKIKPQETLSRC